MTLLSRMPRGGRSELRVTPPIPGPRHDRIGLVALLTLLAAGAAAPAQDKAPVPPFEAGRHVYVDEGVPGDYRAVEEQIDRLEKARTPAAHYDVVVVRSAGPDSPTATRDYTDRLYAAWRDQAAQSRQPLDEARIVLIVVALDNKQVAVHPGSALSALGLSGPSIQEQIVKPSRFAELARAQRYPEAIADLLRQTDQWIAANDPAVRRRVIAIRVGVALSLLIAAVLGGAWFLHHRARGRLDRRIKEIRSRATDVMDRLDALKDRLKLLPASDPDFQAPMAGETADLYGSLQESVGRLWDRWLQVMDSVDRAQKLARGITSPFKRKALHDAEAQLQQEGAFAEIDSGGQDLVADMDRLNQAHETARGALEAVTGSRPKLDAQVEAIRKLGLPVEPYQEEWTAIDGEVDRARSLIPSDPLGARTMLEALRSRSEALAARAERVAGLFQESRKVVSELDGLKRQVAEHRSKGLRLDEEGGNPDGPMAQADRAVDATATALRAADPDASAKELETARAMLEQARSIIEQVRNARDYCRREHPERMRATERLRAALPHAEEDQRRLEREFAPGSWDDVRRNLDQVHGLLASFDRSAADAAAESSDDTQRYLSGARLLRQLAQQQQSALRLMSGIGDRLNALSAMRDDCRRRRGELEASSRRVEGYFRQNDPIVGTMALDILDQARRGRDAVLGVFERPRPDWPSLRDGLNKAIEGFKVAQDQAEVDVRSHQELAGEYEQARGELERLADLLAGRREDRLAANQRFRSAAEVLDQVGLDLSQPHGEWPRLLEQVRGAVGDLEQAERLAREDIRLAAQAQSEIGEAIRSIDGARGSFAMGVMADTSPAESALAHAEHLLGAQQYEQAIETAGQAQLAARRAHQDAVQQASWRQMQADAERRRWEGPSAVDQALTTAAAAAAGAFLGHAMHDTAQAAPPQPPPMPEPVAPPPPPPTDTSVSSWQSDTGQSSW